MSEDQLNAFIAKVQADESLQKRLQAANDTNDVLAIARDAGFILSLDEVKAHQQQPSDEELQGIAGCNCYFGVSPTIGEVKVTPQNLMAQLFLT